MQKIAITRDVCISVPAAAKPDEENGKQVTPLGVGALPFKTWVFRVGYVPYMVEVIPDYKKGHPSTTPDVGVWNVTDGLHRADQQKRISFQRDILLKGWVGLESKMTSEVKNVGEVTGWSRAYAVGNSLYAVAVSYPTSTGPPASAELFLNSLTIEAASKPGPLKSAGPVFVTYSPPGGGCSIGMPAKPEPLKLLDVDPKKPTLPQFRAEYGNRTYMIGFASLPRAEYVEVIGPDIFDSVLIANQAKATKPPVLGARDGTIFETEYFTTSDCDGRVDVTTTGSRVYVITMFYPSGHAGSPDIDTFFNSFRLLIPG